jgi:hypothetical protein
MTQEGFQQGAGLRHAAGQGVVEQIGNVEPIATGSRLTSIQSSPQSRIEVSNFFSAGWS